MKRTKNVLLISSVITFLVVSLTIAGQIEVLQPEGFVHQSDYDTLTWRRLSQPTVNFCDEGYGYGDSVIVWFRPLAPCSLIALRFYSYDFVGTCLINVWDGSHYNGHIVTTDSTDENGWIGDYEDNEWVPGFVLGHSPIGWTSQDEDHYFWGPFPYTITEMHTGRWVEIAAVNGMQGEVDFGNRPFIISMTLYQFDGGGLAGEHEDARPYHTFRYYSNNTGPDDQHSGWFLHSTSVWFEAVVKYYEPLPGLHLELVDYDIDDDNTGRSRGNGNGLIDPGETIEFPIRLVHRGDTFATNVSAFLMTKDEYVTTDDNFENYGEVAPGDTIESIDHFVYTVSSDVPPGYSFQLSLVLLGEPEYVKTEILTLKVNTLFDDVTSVAGVGDERSGRGIAWGDYDGDGFLDMYVAINGSNVLYRNNGDGRFTDVAAQAGVDHSAESVGTAFFDFDNDGDPDIFCTNKYSSDKLYSNDGDGTFTDVTDEAGVGHTGWNGGTAVGDYDNDGHLDIYVSNHTGINILYRNKGDGTFTDVALEAGVGDDGFGAGTVFGDYDNDGDLDLYLGNQDSPDFFYRNNGDGTFTDVTFSVGLGHPGHASCPQFGDYDNDGDLDLYLSNYGYYYTDPNILYRNNGNGTFSDVTMEAGVGDVNKGADARFGDYDNDGDLDIYLANRGQANVLYRNNGDGTFTNVASDAGVDNPGYDLGAAWGDYENDGDLDMYVVDHQGANTLYRNNTFGNHWLVIEPIGTVSNRDGIGAWVKVFTGDLIQVREVGGRSGDYGQNSIPVEFGLGQYTQIDSVIMRWPSGVVQVLTDIVVDQYVEVIEEVTTPLISMVNYEIDDSEGNSDGHVDFGETILLIVTLRNRGLDATEVRAVLSTEDPYVSITQKLSCFDDMPLDAMVNNAVSPYVFSVHQDCPRGRTISFTLEITSAGDYRHTVEFDIKTAATFTDVATVAGVRDTTNASGALFADFNNDGFLDLYVVNRDYGKERNILYFNNGDGTFQDDTEASGVAVDTRGGAVAGDYDNDGDLDLYVANRFEYTNLLYRNDGHGFFEDVSDAAGVSHGADDINPVFGDYDNDGDLDIFIAVYGRNVLYRNNGDGTFTDVASEANVDYDGNTRASTFTDYDGDGDLDLYVLNKFDENILYRNNDDGTFTDVTHEAGVEGHGNAFGISSGDVDNDGDFDLFVANHFQANILYRNNGDGTFTDFAVEAGVADHNEGRSAAFGDYDNDGYLDIYMTNYSEPSVLYHNNGDGTFSNVTESEGVYRQALCGSVIWGDYDLDGDLDLFLKDSDHGNALFRNNGNSNHWIVVTTIGTISNSDGIGAQVTIHAGELQQIKEVNGGFGFGCQSSLPLEFGLGEYTQADSVVIRWPSGAVQVMTDVPADQYLEITEEVTTPIISLVNFEIDDSGGNGDGIVDPGETISLTVTLRNRGLDATGVTARLVTEEPRVSISQDTGIFGDMNMGDEVLNESSYVFSVDASCPIGLSIEFMLEISSLEGYSTIEGFTINLATLFTDVTTIAGVADTEYDNIGGLAWGDYDNDGDLDIYVSHSKYQKNVLYRNNGDGTFSDVTDIADVGDSGYSNGAAFGDYDNDGDLDIYQANLNSMNILYQNNRDGTFSDVTDEARVAAGISGDAVAWGDYNTDGHLDIYIANDRYPNILFRNNGDGTFTDVTSVAGVGDAGGGRGTAWGDYDNDGDLDIYVANGDYQGEGIRKNILYKNNGNGTFSDVTDDAGVGHEGSALGTAWGDYNNDGFLDIYVTNRYDQVDVLYRNNGDGTFSDVSIEAGVTKTSYGTDFTFGDYDNDGFLDIYVANNEGPNMLYHNNGNGTFADVAPLVDMDYPGYSSRAVFGDYDHDGDLDLYLGNSYEANILYRNNTFGNHWMIVKTTGIMSNVNGIGARVKIVSGHLSMIREVSGGSGRSSQNSLPVEFGLGQYTQADSVIIRWPSGVVQVMTDVPADQYLEIIEEVTTPLISIAGYEVDDSEGNGDGIVDPGETISLTVTLRNRGLDATGVTAILETEEPCVSISQDTGVFGDMNMNAEDQNETPYVFTVTALCPLGLSIEFELEISSLEGYSAIEHFEIDLPTLFTDVTSIAGVAGAEYTHSAGVAWGDYDNDGDLDVYVSNGRNEENILYNNNGDGTFSNVTDVAGVGDSGYGYGAVFGDYDNDGDSDIYLVNLNSLNVLYRNNGDGTFTDVTDDAGVAAGMSGQSVAWADYNNDGYLDIYIANFKYPNILFRNNGDGTFSDITSIAGVGNEGCGNGTAWGDYDNDGDLDIYVANGDNLGEGESKNVLYRNNGNGTFTDVADFAGVGHEGSAVATAWGDYDNDGYLDIYVTNRFEQSDVLFYNNGDGTFTDVSITAGIERQAEGYNVVFGDLDCDGYLDLFVVNSDGPNILYLNNGDGTFHDIAPWAGVDFSGHSSRAALGDYDNDGRIDIYLTNWIGSNILYRNNISGNHWLIVETMGALSNSDGIGTRVTVVSGQLSMIREVSGGSGSGCQNSLPVEFGLGQYTQADSVIIRWPSGMVQVLTNVAADQYLEVTEPSGEAVIVSIPEASAMPGDTGLVYIDVDNVTQYSSYISGMEFALTYNPDLLEVVDVETAGRTYENRNNSWALVWHVETPGELEILIWDMENIGIEPGIGPVAELYVVVSEGAELGEKTTIGFKKTVLSDPDANYVPVLATGGTITFGLKGDVTGSGALNVLDVLAIVNIILGLIPDPTPYQLWAADMDDNGIIDVVDVVALIKYLIGDIHWVNIENKMAVDIELIGLQRKERIISLAVRTPGPIAGVQAKLEVRPDVHLELHPRLPERSLAMRLASNYHEDKLVVLLFSPEGNVISGGSGSVLDFEIVTGNIDIPCQLVLDDIVLVDATGNIVAANILTSTVRLEGFLPQEFALSQNYPNPFNPITDIRYQMPDSRPPLHTTLKVYNVLGQEIRTLVDSIQNPGEYNITWDGRDSTGQEVPSGVYFYQLSVNSGLWSETRRMVLMK